MDKDNIQFSDGVRVVPIENVRKKLKVTSKQLSYLIVSHEITVGIEFDTECHLQDVQFIDSSDTTTDEHGKALVDSTYRHLEQTINSICSLSQSAFTMLRTSELALGSSMLIDGLAGGFWRLETLKDVVMLMTVDADQSLSVDITPYFGEQGYPSTVALPNHQWLVGNRSCISLSDLKVPISEVERLERAYHSDLAKESFDMFPVSKTRHRSASAEVVDYLMKMTELFVKKGILPKECLYKPLAARTELERQMSIEGIAPPEIADSTLAQIFREHREFIGEPSRRGNR
jgi:hypothetical protein